MNPPAPVLLPCRACPANRKSTLASEEAQRLSDEVLALRREASGLQEAVRKGAVEVGELKERLRAAAAAAVDQQAARDNEATSLAQQLQQMQVRGWVQPGVGWVVSFNCRTLA
jgi:predicted  nucleic acid-binding Zn-ribbon protein